MPTGDEWGWAWLPDSDAGWVLLLAAETLLVLAICTGLRKLAERRHRNAAILDRREARRRGYPTAPPEWNDDYYGDRHDNIRAAWNAREER